MIAARSCQRWPCPCPDSKVALVKGAARGIGAAIAGAFVAEGAVVYSSDLAASEGARTAYELGAHWLELDVREEAHWQRAMDAIIRHPGAILTPMWESLLGEGPEREANMAASVQGTPLHRFGTPEEIAAVAVMLASDECTYMTGSELTIDGGLLARSARPSLTALCSPREDNGITGSNKWGCKVWRRSTMPVPSSQGSATRVGGSPPAHGASAIARWAQLSPTSGLRTPRPPRLSTWV